mgnify:CR=1 FL=1
MNVKKLKKIRKRIKPLQVEWIKSLLIKEEAEKVTIENLDLLLPEQTHYFGANGSVYLSYMTDKWIMKILKRYPYINTLEELNNINNKQFNIRRIQERENEWMNSL